MDSRKIPVSPRTVIQRINRKLAKECEQLKATRDGRDEQDLGRYYIINFNRNWIVSHHVDLEKQAQKLLVLAPWKAVAS
jgi:hypothetical protein